MLGSVDLAIRDYLVARVEELGADANVTYGELIEAVRRRHPSLADHVPPPIGVGSNLGRVSTHEHRHGRPLISVWVVSADSGGPSSGFLDLAANLGYETANPARLIEEQRAACVALWSRDQPSAGMIPVDVLDRAMERIERRLDRIERLLRRDD